EEDLAFSKQPVFLGLWLFHFDDHVAAGKNLLAVRLDTRACLCVLGVFEARVSARARLDCHLVPVVDVGFRAVRRHPYPVFVPLDLFDASDLHLTTSYNCMVLEYELHTICLSFYDYRSHSTGKAALQAESFGIRCQRGQGKMGRRAPGHAAISFSAAAPHTTRGFLFEC